MHGDPLASEQGVEFGQGQLARFGFARQLHHHRTRRRAGVELAHNHRAAITRWQQRGQNGASQSAALAPLQARLKAQRLQGLNNFCHTQWLWRAVGAVLDKLVRKLRGVELHALKLTVQLQ